MENKSYSYWAFDDEYISGWQYFGRQLVAGLSVFILIGFYLMPVCAYKRARSLGHNEANSKLWAIWGLLTIPLGFTPFAVVTNTIPHWYLWFSNGPGANAINNQNTIRYCESCGSYYNYQDLFCGNCGEKIEKQNCTNENPNLSTEDISFK